MAHSCYERNANLFFWVAVALLLLACSVNCHAQQVSQDAKKNLNKEFVLLGLVGYNYTDRYISEYSVNGASGGHVNLSSPTSGGSGVTCCAKLARTTVAPMSIKVRWQVDGCVTLERNPRTGASSEMRHFNYKEAAIEIPLALFERSRYLETHFYPDGTVQVQITESASEPRINLNAKRTDKSFFPRCKNE